MPDWTAWTANEDALPFSGWQLVRVMCVNGDVPGVSFAGDFNWFETDRDDLVMNYSLVEEADA